MEGVSWRRRVRTMIRRSGYDIVRFTNGSGSATRVMDCDIWPWIRTTGRFRTLIDIGANTGEYGAFIAGYLGIERAYMFEPQADCTDAIGKNMAKVNECRIFPLAVSDRAGEIELRQTNYGPSSSALPLSGQSRDELPDIVERARLRVEAARLDDVLADAVLDPKIFLKMDVQGFEDRVIDGGPGIFAAAGAVMVEMSYVPMYETQPLFEEVHQRLSSHGLRLAGLQNQIMSARTGRPLFAHCLYLRHDPAH